MKEKLKRGFIHLAQIVYLTASFYMQNKLDAAASACTFGFIFSFMPILLMILTTFFEILHASPEILDVIAEIVENLYPLFDFKEFAKGVLPGISLSIVNIVLIFFIMWMARKLFLSILQGFSLIFKTKAPPRPIINQLFTFAGSLLLVVICTVVFVTSFITRQILSLPFFQSIADFFPILFSSGSNIITNIALYLILFIFTIVAYKVASGTKPKMWLCTLSATLCIVCFYICLCIITTFLNRTNYSTIYGMLSNSIIILLEVYFFFMFFMIFAQFIYVVQFSHSLLLSELYLIPQSNTSNIMNSLQRLLFVTPDALKTKDNSHIFSVGEKIFDEGSDATSIFYVSEGTVREIKAGSQTLYKKGDFFGEVEYLLEIKRRGYASAKEPCTIIEISGEEFSELMKKTPAAATKAISKISAQFRKM